MPVATTTGNFPSASHSQGVTSRILCVIDKAIRHPKSVADTYVWLYDFDSRLLAGP